MFLIRNVDYGEKATASELLIRKCTFISTHAGAAGGAVSSIGPRTLQISDSHFIDAYASSGGAVDHTVGSGSSCAALGCAYVPGATCQCNINCFMYGDCCADFTSVCASGASSGPSDEAFGGTVLVSRCTFLNCSAMQVAGLLNALHVGRVTFVNVSATGTVESLGTSGIVTTAQQLIIENSDLQLPIPWSQLISWGKTGELFLPGTNLTCETGQEMALVEEVRFNSLQCRQCSSGEVNVHGGYASGRKVSGAVEVCRGVLRWHACRIQGGRMKPRHAQHAPQTHPALRAQSMWSGGRPCGQFSLPPTSAMARGQWTSHIGSPQNVARPMRALPSLSASSRYKHSAR